MMSYRFRRRAFMSALSGGVGLKIMLRNLESSAQGTRSPARLLVTHWPLGIVPGAADALWKPKSGSVDGSYALKPFADAGLGPDMTVIRGVATDHLALNGGGALEGGLVLLVTGRSAGGTRTNRGEADDAFAAPGGSFDQILLENAPALRRPGPGQGYANSIADTRTDLGEVSAKCLSYSTRAESVTTYSGGTAQQAAPLLPVLSPLGQYMNLFSGMAPGGAGDGLPRPAADATLKKLVGKRSVLDFAVEELNQVKRLAPAEARNKLTNHTDAVVGLESQLISNINRYPYAGGAAGAGGNGAGGASGNGDPICGGACTTTPTAPPPVMGQPDYTSGGHGNFDDPTRGSTDDAATHAQVGKAHLDVLKAAFICDLIRVGTYQWAPSTSHVGFRFYPGSNEPYQHHATSHRISGTPTTGTTPEELTDPAIAFLYAVETWYFARHAENLATWKTAVDGCGNRLLDFTCVPFLTEVETLAHGHTNMPAMIIGGTRLGFRHGRYVSGSKITINQLWGTIAQAFGYTSTDAPFAAPLDGFWTKP